jgi:hypothetical protein
VAKIHAYNYRVERALPELGTPPPKAPRFGVELELEFRGCDDSSKKADRLAIRERATDRAVELLGEDFVVCKYDSSLGYGVELVTAPAAFPIQLERWYKFFENPPNELAAMASCGMHVHVSRKVLSQAAIDRMAYFFFGEGQDANRKFLVSLAGRRSDNYATLREFYWLNSPDKFTRWKNIHYGVDRHVALNVNENTVEFRLFASTLKWERFVRRMEFVHSFVNWANKPTVESVTFGDYKSFVKDAKDRYPNLAKWLTWRKVFRNHNDDWHEDGKKAKIDLDNYCEVDIEEDDEPNYEDEDIDDDRDRDVQCNCGWC